MSRRGRGEGSIWQRQDGRWEARVDLGYIGGRRRRKALYGATQREVREKLSHSLRDKEQGTLHSGPSETVEQLLASWLLSCATRHRPPRRRSVAEAGQVPGARCPEGALAATHLLSHEVATSADDRDPLREPGRPRQWSPGSSGLTSRRSRMGRAAHLRGGGAIPRGC